MSNPFGLVIEDDADLAQIFAEALQAAQFDTEIIHDGRLAQARLAEARPKVIVLDLHLPHVSGAVLLEQIRADERLNATQVIIATADPVMAEMLSGQADLVLLKPISFGQLRDFAARLKSI